MKTKLGFECIAGNVTKYVIPEGVSTASSPPMSSGKKRESKRSLSMVLIDLAYVSGGKLQDDAMMAKFGG